MTTSTSALGLNVSSESNLYVLTESPGELFSDALVIVTIIPTLLFVFFMTLVFGNEIKLRENSKYIFFMNLVVSDSIFLISIDVSSILFISGFPLNVAGCHFYLNFYRGLFNNGIACISLMSIERFVAICRPLRYHSIFNQRSALRCLVIIWFISYIFPTIEIIFLFSNDDKAFQRVIPACEELDNDIFVPNYSALRYIRSFVLALFFTVSSAILVCTYASVVKVAKQAASSESEASKATKTLRLHVLQLILYLSAFAILPFQTLVDLTVSNPDLKLMIKTFLYFFMFVSPRFFSPFIYGLRDQEIRRCLRRRLCRAHSSLRVTPQGTTAP